MGTDRLLPGTHAWLNERRCRAATATGGSCPRGWERRQSTRLAEKGEHMDDRHARFGWCMPPVGADIAPRRRRTARRHHGRQEPVELWRRARSCHQSTAHYQERWPPLGVLPGRKPRCRQRLGLAHPERAGAQVRAARQPTRPLPCTRPRSAGPATPLRPVRPLPTAPFRRARADEPARASLDSRNR
jgi:hypothetical protein